MTWFDISQPAWRYAFAALILLLVFATVWRATKQPRLVQQNTPRRLAPKPTATQTPREAQHSVTSSSPIHVEQSPAMPAHDVIALTVVLDSKSTRDNPTKVNLPKDELSVVRFQILLEKNQPGPYRAEVLSANGESRFSADSLEPADGTKLSFDVSAGLLKSGDHQVKLTRIGGLSENVGSYYFRVQ